MALPIRSSPELTGESAERFLKKMYEVEPHTIEVSESTKRLVEKAYKMLEKLEEITN